MRSRRHGVAAAGLVAVVLATLTLRADAGPFVGERFAPAVVESEDPQLAIASFSVDASAAPEARFVVSFRSSFDPPADGYRLAVNVGDPTGKRWRWALTMADGAPVGSAEVGDGTVWDDNGPATVQLDPAAGRATIVAPSIDEAAAVQTSAGPAVWANVEIPTPLGSVGRTTTFFSYDALAERSADPSVSTSSWGWIRDADGMRVEGAVLVPGAPSTVAWVNRALVISSPDAGPGLLLDQPVTATADLVRVLQPGEGPESGGYVLINRVTGELQVFDIRDGEPTEIPEASATLAPPSAPGSSAPSLDPPSTRSVGLELDALAVALGLPDDPSELAVTLDRAFTLGDGTVVTTTGVAATLASLQQAGSQPDPEPVPVEDVVVSVDDSSEDFPVALVALLAGFAALIVIGVVVVLLLRRQSRRRHESLLAEGWFEDEPANGDEPRSAAPPEAPAASAKPAREADDAVDLEQPTEQSVTAADARVTQDRALADLEAQFADLIERADRLGGDSRPR